MSGQPKAPQRSPRKRSWPLMIVALLAIGGFLSWLAINSQSEEIHVVEEQVEAVDESEPTELSLDEIDESFDIYLNREVRVHDVEIAARLADNLFWATSSPTGVPILIKVDQTALGEDQEIETGDKFELDGMVYNRDDAVLDAWEATGVIQSDGQRSEAEFATWYLDALELRSVEVDVDAES